MCRVGRPLDLDGRPCAVVGQRWQVAGIDRGGPRAFDRGDGLAAQRGVGQGSWASRGSSVSGLVQSYRRAGNPAVPPLTGPVWCLGATVSRTAGAERAGRVWSRASDSTRPGPYRHATIGPRFTRCTDTRNAAGEERHHPSEAIAPPYRGPPHAVLTIPRALAPRTTAVMAGRLSSLVRGAVRAQRAGRCSRPTPSRPSRTTTRATTSRADRTARSSG